MTRSIGPADQSKLDGKFYIAFDKRLPFDPRTLYINGDLSIMKIGRASCRERVSLAV